MTNQIIPRSFGTHDGSFHADEVTACALLIVFNLIDRDKIVRTRDPFLLQQCDYVCDVGGIFNPKEKKFDHHQIEYKGPLSSAGMILSYLHAENFLTDKQYFLLNHALIEGVDAHDNGLDPQIPGLCTYSHVIANFNPISHESSVDDYYQAFFLALDFAIGHLERWIKRHAYITGSLQQVVDAMKEQRSYLIFEKSIPWMESFFEMNGKEHPALFVIMPSGSHWKLRGIPPSSDHRMEVRKPLPLEWAGLLDDELKAVTGIPGAIFCHKGRFISVWETKEDALRALDIVLNNQ